MHQSQVDVRRVVQRRRAVAEVLQARLIGKRDVFQQPGRNRIDARELIVGEGNSGDRVVNGYRLTSVRPGGVDGLGEVTVALGQRGHVRIDFVGIRGARPEHIKEEEGVRTQVYEFGDLERHPERRAETIRRVARLQGRSAAQRIRARIQGRVTDVVKN